MKLPRFFLQELQHVSCSLPRLAFQRFAMKSELDGRHSGISPHCLQKHTDLRAHDLAQARESRDFRLVDVLCVSVQRLCERNLPEAIVLTTDWLRAGRPRGRSLSPGRGKNFLFPTLFRPVLGPTQPPIQWVPGALPPAVKRPGREADHSPPTSAEVKNTYIYTSTPPYVFTA
jgi:hypothetical protein